MFTPVIGHLGYNDHTSNFLLGFPFPLRVSSSVSPSGYDTAITFFLVCVWPPYHEGLSQWTPRTPLISTGVRYMVLYPEAAKSTAERGVP